MRPLPISREEFARFLQKARPPSGWPAHIGIANSGGPDSTCLLFLIQQYIEDSQISLLESPKRAYSLTVDHALQASSASMAGESARTATKFHVPHQTMRIPWGSPPFPPHPDASKAFESTARFARYSLIWKWMRAEDIGVVAMGHHADDQVETALMRLGRKSSELGGRGMLRCRRWGMGAKNELEWAGYEGMNRWIIRPLLEVPKDRILATCEENELTYVTDSTNFQPDITLRNALRAIISSNDQGVNLNTFPSEIRKHLEAINTAITSFSNLSVDLSSTSERLRAAIKSIDVFAADIEDQVTAQLESVRLPSPPGTLILSSRALQDITNPILQHALILRVLRYVSFRPWGTLSAQARRSKHSLDQIVSKVWSPDPFGIDKIRPFAAGGGVLWTSVLVDFTEGSTNFLDAGGRIKRPNPKLVQSGKIPLGKGTVGWMATRQPPQNPERMAAMGLEDTLNVDLTEFLRKGLRNWGRGSEHAPGGPAVLEMLWDCRFLIRFDLSKMSRRLSSRIRKDKRNGTVVAIRWWSRYYFPKIVFVPEDGKTAWSEGEGREFVIHSTIDSHQPSTLSALRSKQIKLDTRFLDTGP
ncbi:tRNA(Ile)-lysidine synthase [Leucoagaricus sp. SymC.cos]|nr:tRNA(Ile)-lysidine synthase [Leucoagaricus sp. SymC.cos]